MIKKIFAILFFLLFVMVSFEIGKIYSRKRIKDKIIKKEKDLFYGQTDKYPIKEKKNFVVIIPSYNNEKWCEKNVLSVLEQNYDNYRVIYIDDASTDNTYNLVKKTIQEHRKREIVLLKRNEKNQKALKNIYDAIWSLKDDDIVVILDGDDFFAHENVLNILNSYYANPKIWLTYGSYLTYPGFKKEPFSLPFRKSRLQKKGYRKYNWQMSHLKTFYTALFKKIEKKDLLKNGKFFEIASDVAYMIPMLEMADGNFAFVEEILYLYNTSNPISDVKQAVQRQVAAFEYIQSLSSYKPVLNIY